MATLRLGTWGAPRTSAEALRIYIDRACDPTLMEPNMSLNLEIADFVNAKKANTPREASVEVLRHINQGGPREALLALNLLDVLVKNCGYPFHLQISTKEFLNELVRRFPERPPAYPGPVMGRTLELVNEWKNGIATSSKRKEDLVHIRDMWRLLGYKGYRFPELSRNAAIATATDNLKSPEELEEEDRAAQQAKLQELIRRGTPKDLAAAQELMKQLSGYEPERKPDYRAQTIKELDKVQHKAILLNDMLDQAVETREKFARGDAYDQVSAVCKQARPKLQKWISDTSTEDPELMERLLLINDLINNVLDRYDAFKKGDYSATFSLDPSIGSKGITAGGSSSKPAAAAPPNLIDLDLEDEAQPGPPSAAADALAGFGALQLTDPPAGSTNGAASGSTVAGLPADLFSAPSPPPSLPSQQQPLNAPGPSLPPNLFSLAPSGATSSPFFANGAAGNLPPSSTSPAPAFALQQQQAFQQPPYRPSGALQFGKSATPVSASAGGSGSNSPFRAASPAVRATTPVPQPQAAQQQQQQQQPPQRAKSPFDDLVDLMS